MEMKYSPLLNPLNFASPIPLSSSTSISATVTGAIITLKLTGKTKFPDVILK